MKKQYKLTDALIIAQELTEILQPCVSRIIVAGSVRRRKPLVSDIEILYIPRLELRPDTRGLFPGEGVETSLVDERLYGLLQQGVLAKRLNAKGRETWGLLNRLSVHAGSGIPVDFFETEEDCWYNYLVCRTGPAELNMEIATRAKAKGLRWHPYGRGFSTATQWYPARSEQDVFKFVEMPYKEPWNR